VTKESNWLNEYGGQSGSTINRHHMTQFGEMRIIRKILEIIDESNKWCVEFGAGDGIGASNSRSLIQENGYSAVLIEPEQERYSLLDKLYKNDDNIYTLNEYVHFEGGNTLDNLLSNTPIPINYDLLSIDIDGNDYHTWEAVEKYEPKIVCVEYNNTVPPSVEFVQAADFSVNQGAGLLSLYNLAKQKGYELVCVQWANLFFVKEKYFSKFNIDINTPDVMHCSEYLTHIFVGYDGKIFIEGNCTLPWHYMDIKSKRIQHIPPFIQKFPPHYNHIERLLFRIWRFKAHPIRFIKNVFQKLGKTLLLLSINIL
jgi:hypothetical protein